jgi:hypothetical protein
LFVWIITNYFLIVRGRKFWLLGFALYGVSAGWPNWDGLSCIGFCKSQVWRSHWQRHARLLWLDFLCIKLRNDSIRLDRFSNTLIIYNLSLSYMANLLFFFIIINALKSRLHLLWFRLRLCVCLKFGWYIWLSLWLRSKINLIFILFNNLCGFRVTLYWFWI